LGLPLLSGQVLLRDDLALFHLPMRHLYAQALARGDSVIWVPEILAGYYLHGEGQLGMLHPFHLVLYRVFSLDVALNLELVAIYAGAFGGMVLFLRRQSLPWTAALFGALVFAFSGFNLAHYVHPNMLGVIAHMPWLLAAIDVAVREERPGRVACAQLAISLLTASQILLGHPQAVWLSSFMEGLYVLFLLPPRRWSRLGLVAVAKMLGLGAGAIQLLPTWEVVFDSARAGRSLTETYGNPLHPANFLQLFSPYLWQTRVFDTRFPQEAIVYCGSIAAVVPLWLLVRRRRIVFSRLARAVLVLALIAAVLALGERGYLYLLHGNTPLINRFQAAGRYIVLVHFALAVGTAIVLRDLCDAIQRRAPITWASLSALVLAPALGAVTAAAAFWMHARPELTPNVASQLAPPIFALGGAGLVLIATVLVVAAARGVSWAVPALILFAAVDLGYYGWSYLRDPYPPTTVGAFAAGQAQPPDASGQRIQSVNAILTMTGARLANGYVAFAPARALDPLDGQRLRVAGVKWVQTKPPWKPAEIDVSTLPNWQGRVRGRVTTHDALGGVSYWAEVLDPMPRAWLVSRAIVSESPGRDIGAVDIASTALVAGPVAIRDGPQGAVTITDDKPGQIRATTRAATPQLLVLSESWHRGWEVRVGGEPRPVVRVFGDFLGCVVGAGEQDIQFSFRPWSFRAGAWVSLASVMLMFLVSGLGWAYHARPSARRIAILPRDG
jgi:hypothetical protein